MANYRNNIRVARALIALLPATNATASARAKVLSALDELWDDVVLAEEPADERKAGAA